MMQEMLFDLGWDDPLTDDLCRTWVAYTANLREISTIQVLHGVIQDFNAVRFNLYAFCDASLKAYRACIYLQTINSNKNSRFSLLCSKSCVAQVKSKTITLPRLKLCGAIVLVKLLQNVKRALKI